MKRESRNIATIRLKILRRPIFRRRSSRSGMGLAEMALAIAAASVFILSTLHFIASGLRLRSEAEKMNLAATVAQAKMAQLLSRPSLEKTDQKGVFDKDGPFAGFEYELHVKEEQIDLATVTSEGKISPVKVDDKLDPGVQNGKPRERAGQGQKTATGGLVDIDRIVLLVRYPLGEGRTSTYRIETFKSVSRTVRQ